MGSEMCIRDSPYSHHNQHHTDASTTTNNLPPSSASASQSSKPKPTAPTSSSGPRRKSVLHPSIAVLLGVNTHWHIPLLVCRGLSTLPAAWWGLRCLLTFAGEVMAEGGWSVERRFAVTEVFLALLWVSLISLFPWV